MRFLKWTMIATVAVIALLAVVALVPVAMAQGPFNDYGNGFARQMMAGNGNGGFMDRGNGGNGPGFGLGPRQGGPQNSLVAVVAEQLGMERTELIAELQGGKTLAQVIEARGATVESVVEAFVASRAELLAERVANGQLTQEQADTMLAAMKANITARMNEAWTPRGPGQGHGFVDEDGDGVCDHAGTGAGQQFGRMGRWQ